MFKSKCDVGVDVGADLRPRPHEVICAGEEKVITCCSEQNNALAFSSANNHVASMYCPQC